MQGRIIKSLAGFYYVESDGVIYQTRARGNFRKKGQTPYVGDFVDFSSVFSIECSRVVRPANSVENPWHGCQSSGIQQGEPVDVQAYRCWAIQCL